MDLHEDKLYMRVSVARSMATERFWIGVGVGALVMFLVTCLYVLGPIY